MKKTLLIMLLAFAAPLPFAIAQDEPIPKPKPKPDVSVSKSVVKTPATSTTLLLTTNLDCDIKLDGVAQGRLKADNDKVVHTSPGDHILRATSIDGQLKWQDTVTAAATTQKVVKIPLADQLPVWRDNETGTDWTKTDNGRDTDWRGASSYCRSLRLAGQSDWRLPTIDELQSIYDCQFFASGWCVKGNLRPTGWAWSSSQRLGSGKVMDFSTGGERDSIQLSDSKFLRAFCVRHSGK